MIDSSPTSPTTVAVESKSKSNAETDIATAEKVIHVDSHATQKQEKPLPTSTGSCENGLMSVRSKARENLGFGRRILSPPWPMAVFNLFVVLLCLVLFFFFLGTIISDFVAASQVPPTVLGISVKNPAFPDMIICDALASVHVESLEVCAVELGDGEFDRCCSQFTMGEGMSGEDCGAVFQTWNISSIRPNQADSKCVQVQVQGLNGFTVSEGVSIRNAMELSISVVEKEEVTSQDVKSLTLFTHDKDDGLLDEVENGVLSYERLVSYTSGVTFLEPKRYSIVTLDLEISKFVDSSDDVKSYNIRQATAQFADTSANHSDFELEITFASDRIRTLTETYPSFASAFGSAAGWMGALSDGWGSISILFIIEKFILIRMGRRPAWAE